MCLYMRSIHLQYNCASVLQVIVALVLWQERRDGVRSSGLLFIFWLALVLYGALKLRSVILLSEDEVRD